MDIHELLDKVKELEFEDVFPLNRKDPDPKTLCINVGIYLGAIIFMILLIVLLGHITVLGVILWILGIIVIGYSLVGMFAYLFKFMRYF
ncbi:MAG: hypothetical protein IKN17_05565 [Ruminococcus sp.]|nr:hypothetical protein [Ruminococcus sp.]